MLRTLNAGTLVVQLQLCDAVDAAIKELRSSGEFAQLQTNWSGTQASL